jgi:hypothetical protein
MALRHAINTALLGQWLIEDEADDLKNTTIERVTVRMAPTVDEDIGRAVE